MSVVSTGSSTASCAAPLFYVMNEKFHVVSFMASSAPIMMPDRFFLDATNYAVRNKTIRTYEYDVIRVIKPNRFDEAAFFQTTFYRHPPNPAQILVFVLSSEISDRSRISFGLFVHTVRNGIEFKYYNISRQFLRFNTLLIMFRTVYVYPSWSVKLSITISYKRKVSLGRTRRIVRLRCTWTIISRIYVD